MTTFFAIIGFIAVVLFLINVSNSNSQNNVEPYSSVRERQKSLYRLSQNYACPLELLEETIIKNLRISELDETELYMLLERIIGHKIEEAKTLNIHIDDTGYAIIEEWIYKHILK